ncbi:hypothetical protein BCR33DRAFT_699670 [Rhizoclosmatium globosum]|uniref:E3 ubiquitin protein ligase n=1 Tax=Rhizoclosmatium globosum TaxID=329046 RepID=A0A1Y2BYN0_9FUNG|nr:hypothetical protein BCR33DRAFT_699670 [Rhizoclosmatium globosum]|eukprot:ORY39878.1 hypothetical protein BCR33DRAFT_699670 [Rhizoclosmatium globosum]
MLPGIEDADTDVSNRNDTSFVRTIMQDGSVSTANESINSSRSEINKHIAKVVAILQSPDRVNSSNDQLNRIQSRCHTLAAENSELKSASIIQSQRLQDLLSEFEVVKSAKLSIERKYDRLKLDSTPHPLPQPADALIGPPQSQLLSSAGSSSTSLDMNGATPPVVLNDPFPVNSEWETLAQSRLKEIEQLVAEKTELAQSFEAFKVNHGFQPGETLVRQSVLASLEERMEWTHAQYLTHKKRADELQVEVAEMRSEQKKLFDTIETEERDRRKVLEGELKKLETDLARVRTHRDSLQEAAQIQKEKESLEVHHHKEIMFLAGSQKSKIQELESKIERLKLELARNNVDGFLREYFASDAMTDGDSNVFSELKRRLDISEGKVSDLEQLLRSFENTTRDLREKQEILFSESELRSELEKVKSELASVNPEATKAVAELEIKIDFYQKSEVRLVQEIESLSAAWTDLETQNQSKVFNLAEKEEQILKLITERTKFDQKCEKLTRERNMINNQVIALKRQSERQLEQIRRLEERERLLTGQLNSLEKDLATKTVAADMHRKKVTELNQKQLELMDKLEKMHAKFTEAERILAEKMKLLADDANAQRRLQEKIDVLKKKLDSQPKTSEMADSYLQQENENLKLLVKCSSCSNNFKSHILTKCMHTFCKSCLDDLVNSRQRKCPKCGNGFSHTEIRPFYL